MILMAFHHLASLTLVTLAFIYLLVHLFWPKDLLHLPFPLPEMPFLLLSLGGFILIIQISAQMSSP